MMKCATLIVVSVAMMTMIMSGQACKSKCRKRPDQRKFVSKAVDSQIDEIKSRIKSNNLAKLFQNAFPNTLDTTVEHFELDEKGQPDTFVITGDINAMWLRDSSNQVLTYQDFFGRDSDLQAMVKGVIRRQIQYVLLDPYANAFNIGEEGSDWKSDITTRNFLGIRIRAMIPQLHERKFEIDSLASVIRLQNVYMRQTGDFSIIDFNYHRALLKMIDVFRIMQRTTNEHYSFQRQTTEPTDTQIICIWTGHPSKHTGLIRTFFRPSDDATLFQYNIPGNALVSAVLAETYDILSAAPTKNYLLDVVCTKLGQLAGDLSAEVKTAIYKHGLSPDRSYFMFEVDGFGNGVFMDDANLPSLLSLPLFGFIPAEDQLYLNTRKRVLSDNNPYYFSGTAASGVGGPHIGPGYIWPMSLITQALTSSDVNEIQTCLQTLTNTTADTYFIHESFHQDNAYSYTRSWFAWANGMFGELILKVDEQYPELLQAII